MTTTDDHHLPYPASVVGDTATCAVCRGPLHLAPDTPHHGVRTWQHTQPPTPPPAEVA